MRIETLSSRVLIPGQKCRYPQNMNTLLLQSCDVRHITAQVYRDNRQGVGNNEGRGWGVQRYGVECEAEDPAGYFPVLRLLIFYLGSLYHTPCE